MVDRLSMQHVFVLLISAGKKKEKKKKNAMKIKRL
jgi:hypothetical protein